MRLTKGQRDTLTLMGVDPDKPEVTEYGRDTPTRRRQHPVTEADLRALFAFTDRGVSLPEMTPALAELLVGFKSIAITAAQWEHDFRIGLLLPQEFYDEAGPIYAQAKRADTNQGGFERTIWRIMDIGRRHQRPLDRVYKLWYACQRGMSKYRHLFEEEDER